MEWGNIDIQSARVIRRYIFWHNGLLLDFFTDPMISDTNVLGAVGDRWQITQILYHFDRKFTNSENLLAEMADKFSFEF